MNTAAEMEGEVRRLMKSRQLHEAAALCDKLNQQFPDLVSGWSIASTLALRLGEPIIAVRAIDRALLLAPGKPGLLYQRVQSLVDAGDSRGAIEVVKQLGSTEFPSAKAASSYGLLLTRLQLHEEARVQFQRACDKDPHNGQHYYNLATAERFLGNFDAAEEAVNRCLEYRPADADAHLLRAGLRSQSAERNNVDSLLAAHAQTRSQPREHVRICFALFKELEDMGEYDRAFGFLEQGARIRRGSMQYTPENDLDTMREICTTFVQDTFDQGLQGHVSAEPIFVIGMPRTGTTLVERILVSHSVVESAGESQAFAVELIKQCQKLTSTKPESTRDSVRLSADVDFAELGENYVNAARPTGARGAHFVDKLPLNFLYAGSIHLALPKAKIVLLERDGMDTCFAVFKTLFEGIYPFSYDLGELANYFVEYKRLVDHWKAVIPGAIHVVRYEELAADPQPVIEGLLEFCNLSFEEGCRSFFENPEAATTASVVHARSDLYTTSIGKWRHYEDQLKSVSDILESAQ